MHIFPSISDDLSEWALSQSVFFVASAPLYSASTHVNVSPKGMPKETLAILSPNQCAYLDATGSGCETVSHIYENGRVTIMFMSLDKSPRIVRLFCKGRVVEWDSSEFEGWVRRMGKEDRMVPGVRAVIVLDVLEVQTSCGWAVPLMSEEEGGSSFQSRPTLSNFTAKFKEQGKLQGYQAANNSASLDKLPGLRVCRQDNRDRIWATDAKARARRVFAQREGIAMGVLLGMLMAVLMVVGGRVLGIEMMRM